VVGLGLLLGCPGSDLHDFDGDGAPDTEDCAPADPEVGPLHSDDVDPDGLDTNCDGVDGTDGDGDGFASLASGGTDCLDDDPAVWPGATEVPDDGVDNDCSGGDATCDADNDGVHALTCGGLDCDDTSDAVHPGAAELCDGADGDCDGVLPPVEADSDGDGLASCAGDCDDTSATVHPGAVEACDGVDSDCDGVVPPEEADADADGAPPCAGDCDDADPTRHPAADEVCDGLDTDCDGSPGDDEDDPDGDTDPACSDCDETSDAVHSFDLDSDGFSPCAGDCDDTDPVAHPGAVAPWGDDVDANCDYADGLDADGDDHAANALPPDCDDDPLSPAAPQTFPGAPDTAGDDVDQDCDGVDGVDADGDGVASDASGGADCNDDPLDAAAPVTFPGADDQVGDSIDYDCDDVDGVDADGDGVASVGSGGTDCNDDPLDAAAIVTLPGAPDPAGDEIDADCDGVDGVDADGDGVASEASGGTDCNDDPLDPLASVTFPGAGDAWGDGDDTNCDDGDGVDSDGDGFAVNGPDQDCDDDDDRVYPGSVEVWDSPRAGRDTACDGDLYDYLADADRRFVGPGNSAAGDAVAGGGDFDADGVPDLLVAIPLADPPAYQAGQLVLLSGVDVLAATEPLGLDDAHATIAGLEPFERLGSSVAWAGDVDGDGLDDVLVGAPQYGAAVYAPGRSLLFLGATLAAGGALTAADADASFHGDPQTESGSAVAGVGDVDGDGLDDLLVGAPATFPGIDYQARAYLLLGSDLPAGGAFGSGDAHATVVGAADGDRTGWAVAGAGDVDGDGLTDILVGAPAGGAGAGVTALFLGSTLAAGGSFPVASADVSFVGASAGDASGSALAGLGDIDGDGLADFAIGAPEAGGTGAVYLVLGGSVPASGSVDLAAADAIYAGEDPSDQAGGRLAPAGDVDGDGSGDLLVSAIDNDDGVNLGGKVYLLLGSELALGGTHDLGSADAAFVGEFQYSGAGEGLAPAGDLDGDGADDLWIGAGYSDPPQSPGQAYLLFGRL